MGKYKSAQDAIFLIFASPAWVNEKLSITPHDVATTEETDTYLKLSVITSGKGVNRNSVSGILIIDIYSPAAKGPNVPNVIADTLDNYLQNKSIAGTQNVSTQFGTSNLYPKGRDKDNKSLVRSRYEIPFNFFESI